jgi:hypothetical protein
MLCDLDVQLLYKELIWWLLMILTKFLFSKGFLILSVSAVLWFIIIWLLMQLVSFLGF